MDVEFWIYIIIGVIYFLSRLLKKGEQASSEEAPQPPRRDRQMSASPERAAQEPKPMTFEELLREITEGKQVQKPQPERVPSYETYQRDAGSEAQSLEDISVDEEENIQRWKPYEEIPPANIERKSLEETLRLEDTLVEFRKFDAFEQRQQERLSDNYIRIIRNPETLKQAVVMSEILKRKF